LKAAFQQTNYKEDLSEALRILKRRVQQFNERATTCGMQMQRAVLQNQYISSQSSRLSSRLQLDKMEALARGQEALQATVSNLQKYFVAHSRFVAASHSNPRTGKSILRKMLYNEEGATSDWSRLLDLYAVMRPQDQNRAALLMKNPKLHEWLVARKSSPLLVHGRGAIQPRSPVTLACASLVKSLHGFLEHNIRNVITLSFFCGEHTDLAGDRSADPAGMMVEFIGQLLASYDDFDFTQIRPLWQEAHAHDLRNVQSLGHLFHALISQLPESIMLFCVVDGVSYYEEARRRDDLLDVVEILLDLAQADGGPVFKLLMTCPASSNHVWQYFGSDETLNMSSTVTGAGTYQTWALTPALENDIMDAAEEAAAQTGSAEENEGESDSDHVAEDSD
jgi:hypothetical protein